MKIKQKIIALVIMSGIAGMFATAPVAMAAMCGGAETSIINCSENNKNGVESNGAWYLLKTAIQIMIAGVGILAVAGIVYGGVLYASAGGSAEQVKKAIGIITNVVIGLLAFALMFAISNFLIPGGIFG